MTPAADTATNPRLPPPAHAKPALSTQNSPSPEPFDTTSGAYGSLPSPTTRSGLPTSTPSGSSAARYSVGSLRA